MRGRRLLTALALVCAGVSIPATAAPATTNAVAPGRLASVRIAITVTDLAPAECRHLQLTSIVTVDAGTNGAKIRGTKGNDLILGTGGDDVIAGHTGDDCLVGGAGVDDLDGGPGTDVCLPGAEEGDATARCEA